MQIVQILQRPKVRTSVLSAAVATLFLVSLTSFPQLLAASTSGGATSSVQVSIQPSNIGLASSYGLTAYNSSGWPVASYSGQYPQVTFQLPTGKYLFAANVYDKSSIQAPTCVSPPMKGGVGVGGPPAAGVASGASSAMYPCYYNPQSEYGYSLTSVSGSTDVNIATQSTSNISTANISVSVNYKNGTAVSDAYVYGNVVGANWYWGNEPKLTMYAQTGADGVAHLVVPVAPLSLTASKSVQVNIPKSESTVQVSIGGQLVNVTVYYGPSYVYLSGTGLLVPLQTSLSLVVTAQTRYPVFPYASGASGGPVAAGGAPGQAIANSAPSLPASPPQQQGVAVVAKDGGNSTSQGVNATIPPIPADALVTPAASQTPPVASNVNFFTFGTLALAGAIAALVGLVIKARR